MANDHIINDIDDDYFYVVYTGDVPADAWGPFESWERAEEFVAQDKWLESWTTIGTCKLVNNIVQIKVHKPSKWWDHHTVEQVPHKFDFDMPEETDTLML